MNFTKIYYMVPFHEKSTDLTLDKEARDLEY